MSNPITSAVKLVLQNTLSLLKESPLLPWVVLFIFLNLFVTQSGGKNAMARIAQLRAATEQQTLHINDYKEWTIDWSLSPNGNYYSNKAPGAFFIGLPIFALTDGVAAITFSGERDSFGRRPEPGYWQKTILVFFTQILPFSLLVLFLGKNLQARAATPLALHCFAVAALFGNTAALYMNSFFGHSLAAIFFLLSFFALLEEKIFLSAFSFGFCLLTDYAAAPLAPLFVLAVIFQKRINAVKPLLLGAALPGVLWIFYHQVAFGSPLAIASQFINPEQVELLPNRTNHWGTFAFLPDFDILKKLLFSPERGLLFTQPWLLFFWACLPFLALKQKQLRLGALYLFVSLCALLWLNAGFGGWHGGFTLGPRYLCLAFPAFAYFMGLSWISLPQTFCYLLGLGVFISYGFRAISYPFSNLAPVLPLWSYHWQEFFQSKRSTPWVREAIFFVSTALTGYWLRKRKNKI